MIAPPIVVDARGNLLVFSSRAEAEAHLDPGRVKTGEYPVAYDREGRLLRIQVRLEETHLLGLFKRVSERTEIVETEHIATHEAALRALLLRFIRPGSPPDPGPGHPMAGLIRIHSAVATR